jgi:CBS-domain-containing membrane protein
MHRTVQDVMTRDVVVARPTTSFQELVRLLTSHRVSAVPVVDAARRVVGIVSESDLVLKETVPRRAGRAGHVPPAGSGVDATERAKAAAITAEQLMTAPVVCVHPEEPVASAARRMHDHKLKRLPVTDRAGVLIGIVTLTDLLKVFVRSDEDIRFEIVDQLGTRLLRLPAGALDVAVTEGVVRLGGRIGRRSQAVGLEYLAGRVDGVVAVDNRLAYAIDDLAGKRTAKGKANE